jgi:DNA-binding transcriptional LysR family regulator
VPCRSRLIVSDPEAIAQAARQGLGGTLVPFTFTFAPDFAHVASGESVRLPPGWHSDAGPLSMYYPSRSMVPANTRVFVDFFVERLRSSVCVPRRVDGR